MSDLNVQYGGRILKTNRAFVESAIARYEDSIKPKTEKKAPIAEEAVSYVANSIFNESARNHYISFRESVRIRLLSEALYRMFAESVGEETANDPTNSNIMHAIVNEYISENGYINIMNNMKTASNTVSYMHRVINESATKILEAVDKDDPSTFTITPEMKDDFFKQLDYSDTEAITDAIHDRVSTAMDDFVTANKKDHEDIAAALQQAQEKIESNPAAAENEELREAYNMQASRKTLAIRQRPKSVFHAMVSAMCESVMRHEDSHAEFMTEGHLNVEKIVDRTKLMYTFVEMLMTARIEKIDEAFLEQLISDMAK